MKIINDLKQLVNAQPNKTDFCRRSGVSWTSLHRMTSLVGNPRLRNVIKLLAALRYKLEIVPEVDNKKTKG